MSTKANLEHQPADYIQKKSLVLVPSAYKSSVLGDVINFVDFYKNDFDVSILVNDIQEEQIEKDGYRIVNVRRPLGKYIRATADYVIDAGTLNNRLKFPHTAKWYSVWHGVPYKRMFLDIKEMDTAKVTAGYVSAYDAMISSSAFYTNTFLRGALGYTGEIHELGCSRIDSILNNNNKAYVKKIRESLSIPEDKKVILYAPTYREAGEIEPEINLEEFFRGLGDEYYLLVKLHYTNKMSEEYRHPNMKDVTFYENIGDLYLIADLMITDYSSTMFDYAVLDRPTIFFQYDLDDYLDSRGTYFQINTYVDERLIVRSQDGLLSLIKDKNLHSYRNALKETFMPHEDGRSTERIVKRLNLDPAPRKHKDIIFLVNLLNEIGGVHTFVNTFARHYKKKYNARIFVIAISEFNHANEKIHLFDKTFVDCALTIEHNKNAVIHILKGTDGIVISTQYSAYRKMQRYLSGKDSIFMFHGNAQELIDRIQFPNHLNKINEGNVYNYKKILLLSKENVDTLKPELNERLLDRLDYVENTCTLPYKGSRGGERTNRWAYVGRLSDEKNPLALIDTAKVIKDRNLDYKIDVYGDGPLKEELHKAILENDLSEIIFLKGYIENKDELFFGADGIFLPSKNEGFPMVILESYSFGKPVVAFDTFSSASELIENRKTGFLVEFDDFEAVVDSMEKSYLLDVNNIEIKFKHYSPDEIFGKWDKLFESLSALDSVEKRFFTRETGSSERASLPPKPEKQRVKRVGKRQVRKLKKSLKKMPRKTFQRILRLINARLAREYLRQYSARKYTSSLGQCFEKGVSIVIPYYNNSETLHSAIVSVLSQKLSDYEIIIVNDGSTDDEANRLAEMVTQFKKGGIAIKQFNTENLGPGSARNFGIRSASKEYVFFLDADDAIPQNGVNRMLSYALVNDLEAVSGLCQRVYLASSIKEKWYPALYSGNRVFPRGNQRAHLYKDTISTNKLYKREIFDKYRLFFESGLYEDKLFTAKLYSRVERLGVVKNRVYLWLIYEKGSSITTTKTICNFRERVRLVNLSWDYYSDYVKLIMFRHMLRHDFIIALREFKYYTRDEKKIIFEEMTAFTHKNAEHFYQGMYGNQLSIYLFRRLMDDDFNSIERIGDKISDEFYRENEKV